MAKTEGRTEAKTAESKWVSLVRAKLWRLWYSTAERRLVTIASSTPIKVIPVGPYRVPIYRRYDSLAYVDMGPKQLSVCLEGNTCTSDKIAVEGWVSVEVMVKDDESCIKRIAINSEEEEKLLTASTLTALQETIVSCPWRQVMSVGEDFRQSVSEKLSKLLHDNSCFVLKNLTIQVIRTQNKALAEALEKAERVAAERKAKEEELQGELHLKKLSHESELEMERGKMKLEQEKVEAQISTQQQLSEVLKTEEGRIAVLPKEMFGLFSKRAEIEILDRRERERFWQMLFKLNQAILAGKFSVARPLLERMYNIQLAEKMEKIPELGLEEEPEEEKEALEEEKVQEEETQEGGARRRKGGSRRKKETQETE